MDSLSSIRGSEDPEAFNQRPGCGARRIGEGEGLFVTERAWIDIRRMVYSLVLVASITAAARVVLRANATTAGFLYLIVILGIATAWGRAQSVAASITAVLCFNYYFLPPLGRFTIEDPENWVALLAFLVTSLVASHLSDRAKQQAMEARQQAAGDRAVIRSEPGNSAERQEPVDRVPGGAASGADLRVPGGGAV